MKEYYLRNKEDIDKVLRFAVLAAVIYVFFKYLSGYFAPLILGYVLSLILSPAAKFLRKRLHFPKALAAIASLALMLLALVLLGNSLVSKLISEGKAFIENSPELIESTTQTIRNLEQNVMSYIDILPESMRRNSDAVLGSTLDAVTGLLGTGVKNGSVEIVKFLPNTLFVTLLGLICAYFLLIDRKKVEMFVLRQLPHSVRHNLNVAKKGVVSAIGGYVRAELTLMCIVAVICTIGLLILKSPYALLLGVLISFVDALPVFGSGAILWPWCLYSVLTGNYKTAIGIAIIDIVVIIVRQTLEPRILGNEIGLHPLATLMSIFIGLKIFGLFGFIIGPIILVTIKAMQDSGLLPAWK